MLIYINNVFGVKHRFSPRHFRRQRMAGPRVRLTKGLTPSLEHYLRAIYDLEQEKGYARVTDIAERLGVAKPAVSVALRSLRASGLVDHRAYESVRLTGAGTTRAKGVSG